MTSESLMAFMSSSVMRKWLFLKMKKLQSVKIRLINQVKTLSPQEIRGKDLAHLSGQASILCQAVVDVLHEERDGEVAIVPLDNLFVENPVLR